ncbi:GspE/PulE family protein, partial [bacterium]|nr:GspE/PulE family protein [bacterium]
AITPPRQFSDAIVVRIKILSNMDVAERRVPLDGRFTVRLDGREVDVRVSTIPTVYGEKIAMRLLDKSAFTGSIDQLGFEQDTLAAFRKGLRRPYGMVLISGPTGSGKTTSLYGGLSELDRTSKNITTLEDPVEYHLDRINQVSINIKAGMTFARGLRAFLRQDPDIIMIGEIRDAETAELAVRAALTGHLVLSTVHANDAPSSLTRLVDIGIEPYLVTSSVHVVMAQRLVRRVCPECKESYDPDPSVLESVKDGELEGVTFYRGAGCKHCKGRGYRGRVGIYELMVRSPEITRLVLDHQSSDAIKQLAVEQGMRTLREGALMKVREGVTTIEEALSIVAETA